MSVVRGKRIGIVYPFGNLDSVPSIYNTIMLLAQTGYQVDIFTQPDELYVRPDFEQDAVTVLPLTPPGPEELSWFWRLLPGRITHHYYLPSILLSRHRHSPYVCMIGVDPQGLIDAQLLNRWLNIPLAYYSLELFLSYELTTEAQKKLKQQESELSRRAAFVVIQDEERAELLARDNRIEKERIITVPNAPLAPSRPDKTSYFREKFDIPAHKKIILNSGVLGDWSCAHQLACSTRDWPEDWILIFHTRYRANESFYSYKAALEYLGKSGQILFSNDPLPAREYPELVRSADIGIAFYQVQKRTSYTQDNIRFIGRSSGKFSYYLWAGLPVIVNSVPYLEKLVNQYHCGEVAPEPSRTASYIQRILDGYEDYRNNAIACFDRELDFARDFDQVLSTLEKLGKVHRPESSGKLERLE